MEKALTKVGSLKAGSFWISKKAKEEISNITEDLTSISNTIEEKAKWIFNKLEGIEEASATRFTVGGRMGWTTNFNYTIWAQQQHFHLDDWLFFIYDRNQMDVLEVNKTNYENCIADHPLHNWTTGAGRDVVPLIVTRHYYFISGKGFCYGGMKLAVLVKNPPPPPMASPSSHNNESPCALGNHMVMRVALALAAVWCLFINIW